MPQNNQPFDIGNDNALYAAVRDETGYDAATLPETATADDPDLAGILDSAKRVMALKTGVTSFYGDRGTAVALLGLTCAKAKGTVENSPVRVEDIGPTDVTYRTSDGNSLQLSQYEQMTELGLGESDQFDDPTTKLELTNTYLTD